MKRYFRLACFIVVVAACFGINRSRALTDGSINTSPAPLIYEKSQRLTPLTLAVGDFNEDGVDDLVLSYRRADSGLLLMRTVDGRAIYPATSYAPAEPLAAARPVAEVPIAADLVIAGDFNADSYNDLAVSARGLNALYFLFGDGQGYFTLSGPSTVEGEITAMLAADIDRADGLTDLIVATTTNGQAGLLIFESAQGAANAHAEIVRLPAPARDLTAGLLDEDNYFDIAVATATEELLIAGRDRRLHAIDRSDIDEARTARVLPVAAKSLLADNSAQELTASDVKDGVVTARALRLSASPVKSRVVLTARGLSIIKPQDAMIYMVTTTADSGAGSLRQAITDANANAGVDTIRFNIATGAQSIALMSPLPAITESVIIDGSSQPGFAGTPLIELNGSGAGTMANGLTLNNGSSLIRFLIINRFSLNGILINSSGNTVEGNYIGITGTGAAAGNGQRGIFITTPTNTIGGTTSASRNIVSGNIMAGIAITGPGALNNVITGNFIGTDPLGTTAVANGTGVIITEPNNRIGGTGAGAGNLISGNNLGLSLQASGVIVQGNLIGTTAAGNAALGNGRGIEILASNITIGGTTVDAGNVIAASTGGTAGAGITAGNAAGVSRTLILGNQIGTDRTGMAILGNTGGGVIINGSDNSVGGPFNGAANIIANNGRTGVTVQTGFRNPILSNSIFGNTGLGIDLGGDGITANDGMGDFDLGVNNQQNFPVIATLSTSPNQTIIQGMLTTAANMSYRLEFFANSSCNAAGNGEGQRLLATANVTSDNLGMASFRVSVNMSLPMGNVVTATATDLAGNTSEFSLCAAVNCPFITLTPAMLPNALIGQQYNQTLAATAGTGPFTFTIDGSLPIGLTFNNGTISGVPQIRGSATFTVNVAAANGCSASQSFTLNVICPTLSATAAALPNGSLNVPYNQTLTGAGGQAPYTFMLASGSLPPGLSLTGNAITGTPTQQGTFNFALNISDANTCANNQNLSITIDATPALSVSPLSLDFGLVTLGVTQMRPVTITNNGGGSITISSVQIATGGELGFAVATQPGMTALGAGQSTSFMLSLRPVSAARSLAGTAVITTSAGVSTVTLVGRGFDPVPPTVNLLTPSGGETVTVGDQVVINFSGTDNDLLTNFIVSYSTDGGASFNNDIARLGASATNAIWNVPFNARSNAAVVRVVALDASGNRSTAASSAFTVLPRNNSGPLLAVTVSFTPPPPGQIAPPTNVTVVARETVISNSLSPNSIENPVLLGFNIFRALQPTSGALPAPEVVAVPTNLVGSLPATITTFQDIASVSVGPNFIYVIVAVLDNGMTSAASAPVATNLPVLRNPVFARGALSISAADSLIQPGAQLIVNGVETFPLAFDSATNTFVVAKNVTSTPGNLKIKKVLRKGVTASLVVRNPDGRSSVSVNFTRN